MSELARYTMIVVGDGPGRREQLLTHRCPLCGADWRSRDGVLPRPGGHRSYWCQECGELVAAVEVDADGEIVRVG